MTYSILYRDSNNLDYDGVNIHSNYNGWVQRLSAEINAQLSKPQTPNDAPRGSGRTLPWPREIPSQATAVPLYSARVLLAIASGDRNTLQVSD